MEIKPISAWTAVGQIWYDLIPKGKSSQLPEAECLWRSNSDRDSGGDARADTPKDALRKSRTMISITDQLRR